MDQIALLCSRSGIVTDPIDAKGSLQRARTAVAALLAERDDEKQRADENFHSCERIKNKYTVCYSALMEIVKYVAVNEVASAPNYPIAPIKMKKIAQQAIDVCALSPPPKAI
jgi:hypothetical protein